MRYSSKREAIRDAVRSTKCHPDAEWVYDAVRKTVPGISLGTVYRNLKEMSDAGELDTVETEGGVLRFDADTSRHAHFVCKSCGKVEDLFGGDGSRDLCEQLTRAGYKVSVVKTVVYGVCADCARKEQSTLS